ncbi:hypothetical protein CVT24_007155 [Panaeolus cyanescens]|uniref:Uncharacterized protein n=1 Tax=Panaeolus cyanescens TaxID=181874 RepID=A0A409YPI3_9AGAR|nr:hypothetical protein CVT24_007155 [Panaeolus cyanescens]
MMRAYSRNRKTISPPSIPSPESISPFHQHKSPTIEDDANEKPYFCSLMGPPLHADVILEYCGPRSELWESAGAGALDGDNRDPEPRECQDAPHQSQEQCRELEGPIDDSEDEDSENTLQEKQSTRNAGGYQRPPTAEQVKSAFEDLVKILRPPRKSPRQRYKDPHIDKRTESRLLAMKSHCAIYLDSMHQNPDPSMQYGLWSEASRAAAIGSSWTYAGKNRAKKPGAKKAKQIRKWVRDFIGDREELPGFDWSTTGRSLIDDEDIAQEIHTHLQSLGPYFSASDLRDFVGRPEMLARLQRTKTISLTTAQRWMSKMGYRWTVNPKGQYVDGHERKDVTTYRQDIFLPAMKALEGRMRRYGKEDEDLGTPEDQSSRRVVVWYHDESIFYAHDRRRTRWVHKSETAKPYQKGEGVSLMVADFVSADYGWLRSPDSRESARVLFRPGKNREGYFDNKDIREQASNAIKILKEYYPDEDHVLVFDNATTHQKRADDALSATQMTKGPSAKFGVEVNDVAEDGKKRFREDGKVLKKKIHMGNGWFQRLGSDERVEQCLYFPDDPDHPHTGQFKGITNILRERGLHTEAELRFRCGAKMGDCPPHDTGCCQRRVLYSQPDFVNVPSLLETECAEKGIQVLFLPKFHCELNFIEQCWGAAKRAYRLMPASSSEADLEKNVAQALATVDVVQMRRFATRSLRFMDAYRKGLTGTQAAWAAKRYRGHRVIPASILQELLKANIK